MNIVCYRELTNKQGKTIKKRTIVGALYIDGANYAINLDGAIKLDSLADQWLTCFDKEPKPPVVTTVAETTVAEPTVDMDVLPF